MKLNGGEREYKYSSCFLLTQTWAFGLSDCEVNGPKIKLWRRVHYFALSNCFIEETTEISLKYEKDNSCR